VSRKPKESPTPQSRPFPYADYVTARRALDAAVAGEPFYGLLTGASGTGKTCLLRELSEQLDRHRHLVVYVSSKHASLVGVARLLAVRVHVTPRRSFLESPSLFPLKRRIGLRLVLAGLRRDELDAFVVHRFGAAEAARLGDDLRDELFERTQAAPALIDRTVHRALAAGDGPVYMEQIRAVLDSFSL
jgi:type II secretory pathway predicted ATPase ExeA